MRTPAVLSLAVAAAVALIVLLAGRPGPSGNATTVTDDEAELLQPDRVRVEHATVSERVERATADLAAGRTTLAAAEAELGPVFDNPDQISTLARMFPGLPPAARVSAALVRRAGGLTRDPLHLAEVLGRLGAEFRATHGDHGAAARHHPDI